ncbi:MAG TPA: prolyl oligopeptidase family serine peptidase [Acidimicrobiales bacterium]|nr:prolyl oligopeptidase family serine peptidase [Acidimicrobiales bacterium]
MTSFDSAPRWEQRFRAPSVAFPQWARDIPDRLAVATNESGAWQVYAWDRAAGERRRVTDHPIGVIDGGLTPDGKGVVWFHDASGDETGHWLVEDFVGGEESRRPLLDGVPDAWSTGLDIGVDAGGRGISVAGTAAGHGFSVWTAEGGGGPAREVHRHPDLVEIAGAGLSRDSRLVCLQHAEHGDTIHLALRVVDPRTGETVAEEWDGAGLGLTAAAWSPTAGDHRLALVHEREGLARPAIWDVDSGERLDLPVDVPGDLSVADWWPDARSLLLVHEHEGRHRLARFHLNSGEHDLLDHQPGTISGAGVRPDGEVWFRIASGASPARIRSISGAEVGPPMAERAPVGEPFRSWAFANPHGERIHGFVCAPPGDGPHPTVMLVHGGPTWAYTDNFLPDVQAWVDHGLAVAMVNYRGSTGYGTAFRDALVANPGFPEVEDVVAGLDRLVADGVADPSRTVVAGGSWGGYVTLLAIGLHPDRWAAAVAAVPVADYATAYADEAPTLQAFDRTLFGGAPAEVGDLYRERSPITYVDRVRAALLVIAGDHDSRCPIQQVLNYTDALAARGGEVEVYRFDAGHGSMVVEERVRQMRAELDFVLRRIGGLGG